MVIWQVILFFGEGWQLRGKDSCYDSPDEENAYYRISVLLDSIVPIFSEELFDPIYFFFSFLLFAFFLIFLLPWNTAPVSMSQVMFPEDNCWRENHNDDEVVSCDNNCRVDSERGYRHYRREHVGQESHRCCAWRNKSGSSSSSEWVC